LRRPAERRLTRADHQPDDIEAAEAAGLFLPINADLTAGPNPYDVDTGNLLIFPIVSSHA
jgi:hypothetical protein